MTNSARMQGEDTPGNHASEAAGVAVSLLLAETAYAADADHVARAILVELIFAKKVQHRQVADTIERGLAAFAQRRERARACLSTSRTKSEV